MLDPGVVHECVFENLLELTGALDHLSLTTGVVNGKGNLEARLPGALPEILTVFLCLGMVKLAEAPQAQVLFARWRLVLLVDWSQEALNFGSLIANNEATKAVLHYVLVGHVKFVDDLSAVRSELLGRLRC